MPTINLDKRGFLINVAGAQFPGPSLTFLYESNSKAISGIFIKGDAVVTIQYNSDGTIGGVFPGKAKDKAIVNIG